MCVSCRETCFRRMMVRPSLLYGKIFSHRYGTGIMTIMILFISHILYLLITIVFTCLNIFPAQKIRNNTLEVPFGILGVSTEPGNYLRTKPIVESEIGFMLGFNRYSRE